jgi:hypothetical protein
MLVEVMFVPAQTKPSGGKHRPQCRTMTAIAERA